MPSQKRKLREIEAAFDGERLPRFTWTPSSQSEDGVANIWYDDGDMAAEVHGNLVLEGDEDELAEIMTDALNEQMGEKEGRLQKVEAVLDKRNKSAWINIYKDQQYGTLQWHKTEEEAKQPGNANHPSYITTIQIHWEEPEI